jgi:hypothetical protein
VKKNLIDYLADVEKYRKERGLPNPEPLSPKLIVPILEAVADENRQELRDLWARLTVAAMDPNRRDLVRQSLITTVKQMDPVDVLVFQAIAANPSASWTPSGRDYIKERLQRSQEEVLVSFDNLERLNCIRFAGSGPKINPILMPLGTLLMRAVA